MICDVLIYYSLKLNKAIISFILPFANLVAWAERSLKPSIVSLFAKTNNVN